MCVCVLSHVRFFATPWTVAPPGSSVHGISQAKILERVAVSSWRYSWPRDRTCVSCIGRWILYQGSPLWQTISYKTIVQYHKVLSRWLSGKEYACNAGDVGSIPGPGRSPGGENDPLQYSCLGNPMDRKAWRAIVHGVAKESDTIEH